MNKTVNIIPIMVKTFPKYLMRCTYFLGNSRGAKGGCLPSALLSTSNSTGPPQLRQLEIVVLANCERHQGHFTICEICGIR